MDDDPIEEITVYPQPRSDTGGFPVSLQSGGGNNWAFAGSVGAAIIRIEPSGTPSTPRNRSSSNTNTIGPLAPLPLASLAPFAPIPLLPDAGPAPGAGGLPVALGAGGSGSSGAAGAQPIHITGNLFDGLHEIYREAFLPLECLEDGCGFGKSVLAAATVLPIGKVVGFAAEGAVPLVRGGVYALRNAEGVVMRTGRTGNLVRREAEHARDPLLSNFEFDPVYRTDNYAEQRGLEQILHDTHNPLLNRVNPIDPANPRFDEYMNAGRDYLNRTGQ